MLAATREMAAAAASPYADSYAIIAAAASFRRLRLLRHCRHSLMPIKLPPLRDAMLLITLVAALPPPLRWLSPRHAADTLPCRCRHAAISFAAATGAAAAIAAFAAFAALPPFDIDYVSAD